MNPDYFSKISPWRPGASDITFTIKAEETSERVPFALLDCWEHFTPFLSTSLFSKPDTEYIFRGQRRYEWRLTPSLARSATNDIVTAKIQKKQLTLFQRAARGRLLDGNIVDNDDELWAIGQHYGLKTPLLDWTYSPYVALFFAFAQQDSINEPDNPYRAVYILNKTSLEDELLDTDIRILEPRKDDHGRLVNQAGLFTFSPQNATIENRLTEIITGDDFMIGDRHFNELKEEEEAAAIAQYICKVYIKNERQKDCIQHLRRMNVHHASLFPDLIGASQYCNLLIDESDAIWRREDNAAPPAPAEPAAELAAAAPEPASAELIGSIRDLLAHHFAPMKLPPLRLDDIADRLSRQLKTLKVVDWQQKESIHAKIKVITRIILRRYDIPEEYREPVIDRIVDVLIQEDNSKGTQP